jgi:hypothetical protein
MLPFPATGYFQFTRTRPDRIMIQDDWIVRAIEDPDHEETQQDGRLRRWKRIDELQGKAIRVILLADGMTVHNAFLDRDFMEQPQ